MRKTLTIILVSFVVALTTCNRAPIPVSSGNELTVDEYEAISAFLAGTFRGKDGQVRKDVVKLIISDSTQSGDDELLRDGNGRPVPWEKTAESLRKKAPTLQQTTVDAFRKANAQQASLRRSFHPAIDYELVDPTQLESIFRTNRGGWLAFYKQFPGSQGVLSFSRVGFSPDGTQAIFYLSNRCGGLCGTGMYVVMDKRNRRWEIGKLIEMWIS